MNERICFHLDENVDPAIALGLRRYGIDVTTTTEVGLRTQTDEVLTPQEMVRHIEFL